MTETPRTRQQWEDQYDITRIHPDLGAYLERWEAEAAAYRRVARGEREVPYGPGDNQRLDVFLPEEAPRGIIVFFHGGYWVVGGRETYSHLAAGPVAHRLVFAVVGYDLAPEAPMEEIVAQGKGAVAFCSDRFRLPVVVAGHSAGGHLAAMAVADPHVPTRHGVAVSGLFDLEPLLHLRLNELLGLTPETARALSPVHLDPPPEASMRLAVGARETSEFHRQAEAMGDQWARRGAATSRTVIPGRHHLSVIEELTDPEGMLVGLCREAAAAAR